ncbi:MAG: FMN-binding protein [Mycobacteriales bacterium]
MRRAFAALAGTVLGLSLLLTFRTTTAPAGPATVIASAAPTTGPSTGPSTAAAGSTVAPRATSTVNGSLVSTRYGPVQVRVTMTNGKITDVSALQLPGSRQQSVSINRQAAPILRTEALAAQSSQIDTVSGATYTSDGYATSLQAALDALKS